MKPELKKLLVLNLPYLLFVYLFAKCGQTYRLSAGADASAKLLHLTSGISAAFASPLPSLHPFDLCVGVVGAVAVRLIVYSKGKNAKKYRKGEEYGSARWGTAKDIAPYIDLKFENNDTTFGRISGAEYDRIFFQELLCFGLDVPNREPFPFAGSISFGNLILQNLQGRGTQIFYRLVNINGLKRMDYEAQFLLDSSLTREIVGFFQSSYHFGNFTVKEREYLHSHSK